MLPEPCESDLIRQAVLGDRVSLSQLLLLHYSELERHISQRLPDDLRRLLLPEDILQETFYRASQSIHRFEDRCNGSFCPWLKTIASNLIKDAMKRRRRERATRNEMFVPDFQGSDREFRPMVEMMRGNSASPSRIVSRQDNAGRLRAAIAGLPPDQREVLQRYYLQEESMEQIATVMDRSKDAIRGICYRAKQNLRCIMGHSSQYLSG